MFSIEDLPFRLQTKIRIAENSCWEWTGAKAKGYGKVYDWRHKKPATASRLVYELLVRKPLPDEDLDHLCRNPPCVNPAHLEPVSHLENVRRGRGREATIERYANHLYCPAGHPLFGENLYLYVTKWGAKNKQCRTCRNEHRRRRRANGSRN